MEEFNKLKTNCERIDFVCDRMNMQNLPKKSLLNRKVKNDDTSLMLRKQANQLFIGTKELMEALQMYTESLLYAENGSSHLGIAYANRSAVLFEKGFYKECLEDIVRAFNNNYPQHLVEKLLKRQEKANIQKKKQKPIRCYESEPIITKKHQKISAAANCIEINENQTFGTHIITNRKVNSGEILSVETPFVVKGSDYSKYLYCHECLEFSVNMIPCTKCAMALYCSNECKDAAYDSYHRYECDCGVPEQEHIRFLKMTLLGAKEHKDLGTSTDQEYYRSDRYKEVYSLKTNVELLGPRFLYHWTKEAAKAFFSLKHCTSLLEDTGISEDALKDMLLHNLLVENTNCLCVDHYRDRIGCISKETIGGAMCAFSSRYNHSCAPNCVYVSYGKKIAVRAIKDIKKGEQCTISYTCSYMENSFRERQLQLKETFYFICKCVACENLWPTYPDLKSETAFNKVLDEIRVRPNLLGRFMELCEQYSFARMGMDIDRDAMLNMAFRLKNSIREPSMAYAYLSEIVYNLAALHGNKLVEL